MVHVMGGVRAMTRLAIALALCAAPVAAQDTLGPDEFSLEVLGPNEARVDYYNSADQQSGFAPPWLNNGDLSVALDLHITRGPETLTVTPPAGWVAYPSNTLTLADGEQGSIYLLRDAEHLGM